MSHPSDYRDHLKLEFLKRKKRNSRYSLRAFAKAAGVAHSSLLAVMAKRRDFSEKNLIIVAKKLRWDRKSLENATAAIRSRTQNNRKPPLDILMFGPEDHELLTYPQAAAIFQIAKMRDHKADPKWLANKLRVSVKDIKKGLEILERKKILTVKEGKLIPLVKGYGFLDHPPFPLMKAKEIENLRHSVRAAEELDDNDHALFMFALALSKTDLQKIRRRYEKFWHGIKRDFGHKPEVDTVYVCISHVFPTSF